MTDKEREENLKKAKRILFTRTDIPEEIIKNLNNEEAWDLVYTIRPEHEKKVQICFTGFRPAEKKELKKIAEKLDLWVVNHVTVELEFLVCGKRAGPEKKKKAEQINSIFLNENEFRKLATDPEELKKLILQIRKSRKNWKSPLSKAGKNA